MPQNIPTRKMSSTSWLTKPKYSSQQSVSATPTAVRKDIRVPNGHIILSDKWRGSPLTDELKNLLSFKFENHLGIVDFHLPGNLAVVYVSEADLISSNVYRQRLAKFKSGKVGQSVVFAESTAMSDQYFREAQKFILLNLRLDVVAVTSQKDAASALHHLAMCQSHQSSNPFLVRRRLPPVQVAVAKALQSIPNLGPVKVQLLMQKFPDLLSISKASVDQLAEDLTISDAQNVFKFFNERSVT